MKMFKNAYILLICFFFLSKNILGQIHKNPPYEYKNNESLEIESVELTEEFTILSFKHTNPYSFYGWVRIMPATFIRVSGTEEKLTMIKTRNIPIYPQKYNYEKEGEVLKFKLYFPPINPHTEFIDFIELMSNQDSDRNASGGAFIFNKIKLEPKA